MTKPTYVYILSNIHNNVLYVGVTSDLQNRILEHKQGKLKGFTKKYQVDILVYYEEFDSPEQAILREKQLKAGSRQKKLDLINFANPTLRDLYFDLRDI